MNLEINLKREVESLLDDVNKTHRYSMSRIYGTWNRAFGRNDVPQSCASCLIRKVKELRVWIEKQNENQEAVIPEAPTPEIPDTSSKKKNKSSKKKD